VRMDRVRVLLTGVGGFVGSHVLRHLLTGTDWQIVALDSFRHRGLTERVRVQLDGCDTSRVSVLQHDLRVPIGPLLAHEIGEIDYVLNLASDSHVDRSLAHPREFVENNVALMLTMLDWARAHPVSAFVQISTDEVYGPAERGHEHAEWETLLPSNPYSASKAAQECIAFSYWRSFGVPVLLTNTMNIIGELQDPEKFLPLTIRTLRDGGSVPVHASPEGRPGHASTCTPATRPTRWSGCCSTSPRPATGRPTGRTVTTWSANGSWPTTRWSTLVAELMGVPARWHPVDFHGARPGHDLRYALDGAKLASHRLEGTAGADRVAGPHRGLDAGPPAVAGAVSDAQVAGAGAADRARHHLHGGRDSRAVPARGHPH
jgi:dTDP-glucose 4,6-dehydratase